MKYLILLLICSSLCWKSGQSLDNEPDWDEIGTKIADGIDYGKDLVHAGDSGDILDIFKTVSDLASLIPGPTGAIFDAIGGILGLFGGGNGDPRMDGILDQLKEMSKTLDEILNAVEETQFIVRSENRLIHIREMTNDMYTADDLFKNMLIYNDSASIREFVQKCDSVEGSPIEFKNVIVQNSFEYKSLVMSRLNPKEYTDLAANIFRLFYHSVFLRFACFSTRYANATQEERTQIQSNQVDSMQRYTKDLASAIEADMQFYNFDALVAFVEKEADDDGGKTTADKFGPRVYDKLTKLYDNYLLYFVTWDRSLNDRYHGSFYPYAGNDRTVVLNTTGGPSYAHYVQDYNTRGMVLYRKGSPVPPDDSEMSYWEALLNGCYFTSKIKASDGMDCSQHLDFMTNCVGKSEFVALGCYNGIHYRESINWKAGFSSAPLDQRNDHDEKVRYAVAYVIYN